MISNMYNHGNEYKNILKHDSYGVNNILENSLDYIFDIGANIGWFSVMMRMRHWNTQIVAVEGCQETLQYLKQNLNMLWVSVEERPLGDGSIMSFSQRKSPHMLDNMFTKSEADFMVRSISIKELLSKYGCDLKKHKFLIKMNIEGAESYLIGHTESEDILRNAQQFAAMMHFKDNVTEESLQWWPTYDESIGWVKNTFNNTHEIFISKPKREVVYVCCKKLAHP